jgi:hypothetical protein
MTLVPALRSHFDAANQFISSGLDAQKGITGTPNGESIERPWSKAARTDTRSGAWVVSPPVASEFRHEGYTSAAPADRTRISTCRSWDKRACSA